MGLLLGSSESRRFQFNTDLLFLNVINGLVSVGKGMFGYEDLLTGYAAALSISKHALLYVKVPFVCFWRCGLTPARVSSFTRFLFHTHNDTPPSVGLPLDE